MSEMLPEQPKFMQEKSKIDKENLKLYYTKRPHKSKTTNNFQNSIFHTVFLLPTN